MDRRFFKSFEEDPFFSGMPSFPLSISDGTTGGKQRHQGKDPFSDMFKGIEDMQSNMLKSFQMFDKHGSGNPGAGGHSYHSSSIMTYSNDGKSKPKYYQATSSSRTAPGQIKETRRSVRDSERELEKMAIGHHMGEKAKIMEKRRTRGVEEEECNYIHMDEDESPAFEKEWQRRASQFIDMPIPHYSGALGGRRSADERDHQRSVDRPTNRHKNKRLQFK